MIKKTTEHLKKEKEIYVCLNCDGSGYLKDKEDKNVQCPVCKGKGELIFNTSSQKDYEDSHSVD